MILAAALAAVAFGCTQFGGVSTLRGADVANADKAPEAPKDYAGKKPGRQKPIARTFSTQPPLIPHAVANFDEITVTDNQCMECHGLESYRKKNAPRIGDSHLDAGKKLVAMDRYQCNTCHVPQVDAKPLVDNTFVGHLPKK
jgi:cytochrome c-type protein NapB